MKRIVMVMGLGILLAGCNLDSDSSVSLGGQVENVPAADEVGQVVKVIDGDTIDVDINGETFRVRYVGVNTPERDEPCYQDAKDANSELVANQTVSLVIDTSETDQYGRLLRYVYVGNTFVNQQLVIAGYAEAVRYDPDDAQWANFVELEQQSANASRGCHPSGIFDDGGFTR